MGMIIKVPLVYLIPRYTEQTKRGIHLCLANSLVVPALTLLYSGIDVLGFLASDKRKAERSTFTGWAESHMDAFLKKKGIGGIDLYSARCGILHTAMAPSELVDSGKARELWYQFRGESHVNLIVNLPQPPVLIDVEEMASAFSSGVEQFIQEMLDDAAMGKRAEGKANRFFRPGLLAGPVGSV
jgi:hypothetical protein